jgi:hypothetical protein
MGSTMNRTRWLSKSGLLNLIVAAGARIGI